jgi:transmembrane sensor
MNPRATKEEPIPADRLAEAGVWIARLYGDDRNADVKAGLQQWLAAHPLNAQAFELTTEVWEDSQNLRRVVPFAHEVSQTAKRRFRFPFPLVAVTAALVILATGVTIFFTRPSGVTTEVGEQRLLTLKDGSRIFLNTATRVVVHYDQNARRIELKAGEALFDVAKRPHWPFIVDAGDQQVTALGTSFVVRRETDRTAVTLVEGKVAVQSSAEYPVLSTEPRGSARSRVLSTEPRGSARSRVLSTEHRGLRGSDSALSTQYSVLLTPGQRLTSIANKPAQLDTPSLDNAIAWRRGQVVLDDTPLANAVNEMNRYNAVKLTIEQPAAANLLVNGLFQTGDSMSFATAVAKTYGLQVIERDNEIELLGLPRKASTEY